MSILAWVVLFLIGVSTGVKNLPAGYSAAAGENDFIGEVLENWN